jgi:ribosomal RNA-processing protein 36
MSERRLLEAASSSEDDSSSDEDEASQEEEEVNYSNIKSLDDLPSDDSVSLESNDCDDDDDGEEEADTTGSTFHRQTDEDQELTLAERIERNRDAGMDKSLRLAKQQRKAAAVAAAKTALKKQRTNEERPSKKSKHAPTEASSTRTAFYNRGAPLLNASGIGVEIGAHKYKPRDPRMSSMSGHLDEEHFAHNYTFIQELRAAEIEKLKQRISVRKTTGKKGQKARKRIGLTHEDTTIEDDKAELLRLTQEMKDWDRSQVQREAKRSVNLKVRQEVESGQRGAYHLKRKDRKTLELEARFDVLRKKGGDKAVDKVLEKKRKKNKSKDTGLMKVNL